MWVIVKYIIFLLIFCPKPSRQNYDHLFEMDPDRIFERVVGSDIYQAKTKLMKYPYFLKDIENVTHTGSQLKDINIGKYTKKGATVAKPKNVSIGKKVGTVNKTKSYQISNQIKNVVKQMTSQNRGSKLRTQFEKFIKNFSIPDDARNMSELAMKKKRLELELELKLSKELTSIPNFDSDDDEVSEITQKFDKLMESGKQMRRSMMVQNGNQKKRVLTRREDYWLYDWRSRHFIATAKLKAWALMEQFVYETRYKLPYVQKLRKKYKESVKYRYGYLFSLLKSVEEQMQWLYSMMARYYNYWDAFPNYHFHLQMFESMVRYNLDVSDLIRYLKKTEYERKMFYHPEYYDYFPY